MSPDLKAKLAQVAERIAATHERLRGLERSAAGVRQELERLRSEAERSDLAFEEEWPRVPTNPLAGAGPARPSTVDAGRGATSAGAAGVDEAAAPDGGGTGGGDGPAAAAANPSSDR